MTLIEFFIIAGFSITILACCICGVKWVRTKDHGFLLILLCLFLIPMFLDILEVLAINALDHVEYRWWKQTYMSFKLAAKEFLKLVLVVLLLRAPIKAWTLKKAASQVN